ncbi:mitochondrial carrier protein [Skeletonema marinoi]|uniref:Mitochondrial carrier protein n=1 Tax=Skeletonema marinoi TaxID=267567 RepID=A0AAD8XRU9_9STRA|nr:mitochondrial carrier protein [Skeletonema marinoi]
MCRCGNTHPTSNSGSTQATPQKTDFYPMKPRITANTAAHPSASSAVPLPPIVHAIGGSIGSALAILTFYPLERIRVEIQSQQQQKKPQKSTNRDATTKKENADNPTQETYNQADESSKETILQCLIRLHKEKSLYRGAKNMAITLMISNFIFFYALQVARKSLASFHNSNNSSSAHQRQRRLRMSKSLASLLASTLAGVINVLLTNPMWVASLRIMESKSIRKKSNSNNCEANINHQQSNLWNVMHRIAKEEGLLQLWNGTFTSLLLVSNPIIQHFLYGQMRIRLLSLHRHRSKARSASIRNVVSLPSSSLTAVEAFVLGAISKMVATVATYPLQLAQVLLRLQSKNDADDFDKDESSNEPHEDNGQSSKNTKAYKGMIDCLHQQFTQGGIRGLFQGMNAKLLSTVLTAAFTFLSYEQTLGLVGKVHQALLNDV